ncbi:MAG: PIN domain-containing protein [Chloroflexota bacterium]
MDTSALYALSCGEDSHYAEAVRAWERLLRAGHDLATNNYVIVESIALFQNRFGLDKVQTFLEKLAPFLQVEWVNKEEHQAAVDRLLSANHRGLSLVDCSAFETMRRLKIDTAFTFDEHFRVEGFKVIQ